MPKQPVVAPVVVRAVAEPICGEVAYTTRDGFLNTDEQPPPRPDPFAKQRPPGMPPNSGHVWTEKPTAGRDAYRANVEQAKRARTSAKMIVEAARAQSSAFPASVVLEFVGKNPLALLSKGYRALFPAPPALIQIHSKRLPLYLSPPTRMTTFLLSRQSLLKGPRM